MPRAQSTAAKKARKARRSTGGKYTELLRKQDLPPTQRLARALHAVGFENQAAALMKMTAPDPEWDAADRAYHAAHDRYAAAEKAGAGRNELDALGKAIDAADARYCALLPNDPYGEERLVCRAVLTALAHAGTSVTSRCLEPAADVLDEYARSATTWADAIRDVRLKAEDALIGPMTPGAAAARAAYRTLAEATRVPFDGDQEWTLCAELIEEAAALARAGCQRRTSQGT